MIILSIKMTLHEEETEVIESFEKMSSGEMARSVGISLVEEGYTFRVVRSQNQLREKIVIFDNKLDDRVIEVMKLFIISHLSESNSELEIENLFLEATESGPEHFAIQLKDGNWGSTAYIDFMLNLTKMLNLNCLWDIRMTRKYVR